MTLVECHFEECELCKDNYCTASDITLNAEHVRDGGCDYGYRISEEKEEQS